MTENKDDTDTINNEINFEDALIELEDIVNKMDAGELSLDESLILFEKGISLTRVCSSKLEHAKQRIENLAERNEINYTTPQV